MSATVSKGLPARKLFVNREELIAEFLDRIHSDPREDILFLYGEGGIGKSLLLSHLEDRYSRHLQTPKGKLLDPWVNLAAMPAREMVETFGNYGSEPLPCARIDFSQPKLRERIEGLGQIRRSLKIPAPFFHSALVLYLNAQGELTKESLARYFPGAGAELFAAFADQANVGGTVATTLGLMASGASGPPAIALGAIAKGLWGAGAELFGPTTARWFASRRLRGASLEDLLSFKPEELLEELPNLLADDINASRDSESRPHRLILLFDSHDSFIGGDHDLALRDRLGRDRWFQDFLARLDPGKGIVVVVTGQEPANWQSVRTHARPVEYLREEDAGAYLQRAEVEGESGAMPCLVLPKSRRHRSSHSFWPCWWMRIAWISKKAVTGSTQQDSVRIGQLRRSSRRSFSAYWRQLAQISPPPLRLCLPAAPSIGNSSASSASN